VILFSSLPIKHLLASPKRLQIIFNYGKKGKEKVWSISYETLWLIQSRMLILRSDQMSTESTPQSSPRLPGPSAEVARQIPCNMVKTLSILDFLKNRLIKLGRWGTVNKAITGSKRRSG